MKKTRDYRDKMDSMFYKRDMSDYQPSVNQYIHDTQSGEDHTAAESQNQDIVHADSMAKIHKYEIKTVKSSSN
jgi:hypothetical protein